LAPVRVLGADGIGCYGELRTPGAVVCNLTAGDSGCHIGGYMASETQISVRQLKNETTGILRRVEAGERLIVTRRGKPVAIIEPTGETPALASDSIYRTLQRQIEARIPGLRGESAASAQRAFERISRKIARTIPYRDWREMDRIARGDRFGLSR